MPDSKPWLRQANESAQAYEAAKTYFELRADRSLAAVGQKLGKSTALLERWSVRWSWVERAAAYDAWLDEEYQRASERAVKESAQRWATREERVREESFKLADALMAKAAEMLKFPLALIERANADGSTTVVKPARWSMQSAARLAMTGNALARASIRNDGAIFTTLGEEDVYEVVDYKPPKGGGGEE